jgi:GNAT superfamily N-acetyltransferase
MAAGTFRVSAMDGSAELAAITQRLLGLLPSWFGIPEANAAYVASAHRLPGLVAHAGTEPIGILLHQRHFPCAAEIHLMAVDPSRHRQGVGRSLVAAVEARLTAENIRMLQVKTLGPSHPDPGYARTRAFYEAVGFLPLQEIPDLWPGNPCLIMVKMLTERHPATGSTDPATG